MSIWVCVCVSLASDSSESVEVIIVKLSTVTASDLDFANVYKYYGLSIFFIYADH